MRLQVTKIGLGLCLFFQLVAGPSWAAKKNRKPASNPRPPQYVLLAFDGSLNNDFWDESLSFAEGVSTEQGKRKMRYTYFINPVYYLAEEKKSAYKTPGLGKPVSCIGWANGRDSIVPRVDHTNLAFTRKHEIGSHANSHCDQSGKDPGNPLYQRPWGEREWTSEFEQFNYLLFNVFTINGLKPSNPQYQNGLAFTDRDVVGFRAPLLAYTDGLWPTLKKFGYRYDTSKQSEPTYWPQRMAWGGWNFPLGRIKVAGTNRTTLSMDYNWLCFQSGCASKPNLTEEERLRMKNQVLDSYKYYFKINYFGKRAPVHIGHHFSKWNKGAYWDAMKEFSKFVCNKPEVKCVTYKEYADWLDSLRPAEYEAYRNGDFEKLKDDGQIKNISTPIYADVRLDMGNNAFEAMTSDEQSNRLKVMGWKAQLQVNFQAQSEKKISREDLIQKVSGSAGKPVYLRASLVDRAGIERNWETYRIDNLGTEKESVTGPLENQANLGETIEAHLLPE